MYDLMFKDGLLKGKRILITGGGTGLGEVMTEAYAQLGAEVYICGRRAGVVEETAKRITDATGSKVTGIGCDIRVSEAVDEMIARIWEEGALTGLVNNAAGNFISRTKDLSPKASTRFPTSSSAAHFTRRWPAESAGSLRNKRRA